MGVKSHFIYLFMFYLFNFFIYLYFILFFVWHLPLHYSDSEYKCSTGSEGLWSSDGSNCLYYVRASSLEFLRLVFSFMIFYLAPHIYWNAFLGGCRYWRSRKRIQCQWTWENSYFETIENELSHLLPVHGGNYHIQADSYNFQLCSHLSEMSQAWYLLFMA